MNNVSFFIDKAKRVWGFIGDGSVGSSILLHHAGPVWVQLKKYEGTVSIFGITAIDGYIYNPCFDEGYRTAPSVTFEDFAVERIIDNIQYETANYEFTESFDYFFDWFVDTNHISVPYTHLFDLEALELEPSTWEYTYQRKNR